MTRRPEVEPSPSMLCLKQTSYVITIGFMVVALAACAVQRSITQFPEHAVSTPAPERAVSTPAPEHAVSTPAPEHAVSTPAPERAVSTPTPETSKELTHITQAVQSTESHAGLAPNMEPQNKPALPKTLLDLTSQRVLALLGTPGFVRRDPPSEFWRYRWKSCVIELYLYRKGAEFRVDHVDIRAGINASPDHLICIAALRKHQT